MVGLSSYVPATVVPFLERLLDTVNLDFFYAAHATKEMFEFTETEALST